ncbi:MAG: hypothetical protein NC453_29140, partial [Muribaculum sp.]|nr:hypothetical protein [Muribaculum sp.]
IQGLLLTFVFWMWRIIKRAISKRKENFDNVTTNTIEKREPYVRASQSNPINILTPWEEYKQSHYEIAKSVELISDENLKELTALDIRERIATLVHMSNWFACPISELRTHCIRSFTTKFTNDELPDVIDRLLVKAKEASSLEAVSVNNTMQYQLYLWLKSHVDSLRK